MITTDTRTEFAVIEAVDRIVSELERALLEEDEALADALHAALVNPAIPAGEREDRLIELAWRIDAVDQPLRRAS